MRLGRVRSVGVGDRVMFGTLQRAVLEITAFERPRDCGEHFKDYYDPTIAARANAARDGREAEFDAALDAFCDEWDRGERFEKEYRLAVGPARASAPRRTSASPRRPW